MIRQDLIEIESKHRTYNILANYNGYVIDTVQVMANVFKFKNRYPTVKILFPVKIAPIPDILDRLAPHVDGWDISNVEEFKLIQQYDMLVSLCGPSWDAHDIYTITSDNLFLVVDGDAQFEIAKDHSFTTFNRVNEYRISKKQSFFGNFRTDFLNAHIHFSHNSRTVENYNAFLERYNDCEQLNIGGGFHNFDETIQLNNQIIYAEPGQIFFENAVYLACDVIERKKGILVLDKSIYCHLGWSNKHKILADDPYNNTKSILIGPTCSSSDYIGQAEYNGNKVIFSNIPATCLGLNRSFNGIPKANITII